MLQRMDCVGACNQSPFLREQETLREICNEPIFRDRSVAELTGHHIAPHDWPTRGRKALEVTLVRAPERSLPGNSVLPLHKNLDFDLKIRESPLIHPEDWSDPSVTQGHILFRDVGDVFQCEELTNRIQVSVGDERRVSCFDLRYK